MSGAGASPSVVWLRQDLRLADQAAFAAAAAEGPVAALYVLDDEGPGHWRIGGAQRWWLHGSLAALGEALRARGVLLVLRPGRAAEEVARFAREAGAARVHALRHYEPWWKAAEAALAGAVELVLHDGAHLLPPERVRTGGGGRYRIYGPWYRAFSAHMPPPTPRPAPERLHGMASPPRGDALADWTLLPSAPDWAGGFRQWTPGEAGGHALLRALGRAAVDAYPRRRNLPGEEGTSRLSPHLHHGEVSPAQLWHHVAALPHADKFLSEIAWRDFTANLVDQYGDYGDRNGRPAFDRLPWRTGPEARADLAAWREGRTGYPIVDAGMRQLWITGWMHNRVRMITASFLVKHLLIDWREGERWFWDTLVDADYGNNSVNWQWVAGSGLDSAQFGRIMAPLTQSRKFEAAGYIREWVPELAALDDDAIHDPAEAGARPQAYPPPRIGHREARERTLAAARALRG